MAAENPPRYIAAGYNPLLNYSSAAEIFLANYDGGSILQRITAVKQCAKLQVDVTGSSIINAQLSFLTYRCTEVANYNLWAQVAVA